ncbi:MAG: hypothetical protein DHS20C21_03310 [Gemmatimonadota bacterium]|nr:MAG: hypothetical protein DHS20C21_03310 [Gemmatimonadota bacterium]
MNTISRLQSILRPENHGTAHARVVRVVITEADGIDQSRVILSPGDRLIVENRTCRTVQVAPLDFFGTAFGRYAIETGESTPPLIVSGLWFQVELHVNGREFYPLDVYLAPNVAGA